MKSKFKLRIICGFREDQEYTIDANEAHKAYYLFNNPQVSATFSNGLSLIGADIRRIVPDYHATMGWSKTHKLTGEDMNELRASGVLTKLEGIMTRASEIARNGEREDIATPLLTLVRGKYAELGAASKFAGQVLEGKSN